MRILLITQTTSLQTLQPRLAEEGYTIEKIDQIDKADYRALSADYDVIILDKEVFKERSFSSIIRWRSNGVRAHILLLLPEGTNTSVKANCLDAGADSYVTHPVNPDELRAHLRALLRRDHQLMNPIKRIHDLEINTIVRTVKRNGRTIHLTPREFDLLQFLAYHQGKVVSRSMIRQHLYDDNDPASSNVVDVYIRYLRSKIDRGCDTPLILTRWGEGYLLRAENV